MIVSLQYNKKQRMFHYGYNENPKNGWVFIRLMDIDDAIHFTEFIDKKYVNNKLNGRIPELDIIKLEAELFFKLKNIKRKLVR